MISVIIPIYNSQQYLENCIESITHQTYNHIEIILIDDGSTDRSLQICQAYSEKDKRIKVVTKQNGGQSFARNLGLELATGKFIAFVDSDDEISTDLFEHVITTFESDKHIDVVQFPVFMNYGLSTQYLNQKKGNKISGRTNLFLEWIEKDNISWIVCNKIFKKEIFDQLRFEKMYYEDNYMVANVLGKINVLKIIEQGIYYYHHRENSTTTSAHSFEKERDTQKVNFKIYECLKKNNLANAKVIVQSKIINVERSLLLNFNKETTIDWISADISFFSVLWSRLSMKEKIKLTMVKIFGWQRFINKISK